MIEDPSKGLNRPPSDLDPIRISNFLTSAEFLGILETFKPEKRQALIGATVEYFVLNPDGQGVELFLGGLGIDQDKVVSSRSMGGFDEKRQVGLLVDSVIRRQGLQEPLTDAQWKLIYDYIVQKTYQQGRYYHAFNGVFEQSIRNTGLRPDAEIVDASEVENINAICNRCGVRLPFGWWKSSRGEIYFNEVPDHLYRYGTASPEWFAQFVSEGTHVRNERAAKEAFYRKDYEQAKENVTALCAQMKNASVVQPLSEDEERQIFEFFEKQWKRFAGENSQPKVALVNRSYFEGNDIPPRYEFGPLREWLNRGSYSTRYENRDVCEFFLKQMRFGNDLSVKKAIPPSEIVIVTLPNYSDVYPADSQ